MIGCLRSNSCSTSFAFSVLQGGMLRLPVEFLWRTCVGISTFNWKSDVWCFGKQLWIWLWDRNEGNLKIKGNHCCVRPNLWPEAMTFKNYSVKHLGQKTTKLKIRVWKDPSVAWNSKCWEVSGSKINMGQLVEGAFDVLRMSLHTTHEMTIVGWKYVTVTTKPIIIHPSRKQ